MDIWDTLNNKKLKLKKKNDIWDKMPPDTALRELNSVLTPVD